MAVGEMPRPSVEGAQQAVPVLQISKNDRINRLPKQSFIVSNK